MTEDAPNIYARTKTWVVWTIFAAGVGAILNYGYQLRAASVLGQAGFYEFSIWNSKLGLLSIVWVLVQTYATFTGGIPKSRIPLYASLSLVPLGAIFATFSGFGTESLLAPTTISFVLMAYWVGVAFARGRAHFAQVATLISLGLRFAIVAFSASNPYRIYLSTLVGSLVVLPALAWVVDREARSPLPAMPHNQSILGSVVIGVATSILPFVDLWVLTPNTPREELGAFARILLAARLPFAAGGPLLALTLSARLEANRRQDAARTKTIGRLELALCALLVPSAALFPFILPRIPFWGPEYSSARRELWCALSTFNQIALISILAALQVAVVKGLALRSITFVLSAGLLLGGLALADGIDTSHRLALATAIYLSTALVVHRLNVGSPALARSDA